MKKALLVLVAFLFLKPIIMVAQTTNDTWAVKFSNAMRFRYNPTIDALTGKGWEYSNTIITHGMEKVFNQVPDSTKYRDYIKTYVDTWVNSSGVINATINSLDRTHPGISCLFLYEKLGTLKYKTAATTLRNMFVGAAAAYPKTVGTNIFWHKNNGAYNNIILIDGVYMLHPFLAKYGSMFGDNAAIDTAVNQTLFLYNQLYDNSRHLIKHAWNPTRTEVWADANGNSSEVWSRGMGWFSMALVDILPYVPAAHPRRNELIAALANLVMGMQTYQDATTGLWYQVVDRGTTLAGNYLETSGSAMFVYTIKKAVDSGWLNASYLPVAQKAWNFLKQTANGKITIYADGYPQIHAFAPAMGVQTSPENYVQPLYQPVDVPGTTHPHGYAAILMAASVMEFPMPGSLPLKAFNLTASQFTGHIIFYWKNEDDALVNYYELEKMNSSNEFAPAWKIASNKSGNYSWTNYKLDAANTEYRVKAVLKDGSVEYSNILSVKNKLNDKASIIIGPNPVSGNSLNILLNKFTPGHYSLQVIQSNGAMVFEKNIKVATLASAIETIFLSKAAPGIYHLIIKGNDTRVMQDFVME